MMSSMNFAVLLVTLLAFGIFEGSALQCHQCTPGPSNDCIKANNDQVVTCDFHTAISAYQQLLRTTSTPSVAGNKLACLKTVSTVSGITGGLRTCFPAVDNVCDRFKQLLGTGLDHCSTCDTDNCNGASSTAAMSFLPISLAAAVFAYYKLS